MGTVDGITYGEEIWRSDPDAAFAEADRRVAMVREDPDRKRLVLSDLYALTRLPPDLATCSGLEAVLIGDATGPDDEDYSHPDTRMLDDWSPLLDLTGLKELGVSWSNFSQWDWLAGQSALQNLNCAGTRITSLEGLAGLPALKHLSCAFTQIASLEGLAGLPALQHLDCAHTQIDSLEGLADLPALQELRIDETELSDLTPVLELGRPIRLMAHRAQIRGLPGEVLSGGY
ncbi:MAG: leucine-rich repeat domain-containing protein, partial [Pseudomonadota bacterium]